MVEVTPRCTVAGLTHLPHHLFTSNAADVPTSRSADVDMFKRVCVRGALRKIRSIRSRPTRDERTVSYQ